MRAERTLDMHGKTVQAAYHALEKFLHAAHADHIRCVEVITGRGSGETGGAIRRELPHWLSHPSLRPLVLAAAHPHARNDGSTRLLLRRGK
jgi:DNA-nicking Smr family endonuclease